MKREVIDGNTACAKASYKLSEMSFIYPITPSSPMAEYCDELQNAGEKNIFGNKVELTEMQSEGGAIGAVHGSALSGVVSTTFTSSQGLLLMLPNMYKIAGEMLPVVINVASRSLASHSLNIFCDHSDVMSARQTGFAMLCSSNPQEVYDFTIASFLTSIKTRIPFLNFFDGFRTSHQISIVNTMSDDEIKKIYPFQALKEYKSRSISPTNPKQYGTSESQDIFFQGREKSNPVYKMLPAEIERTFNTLSKNGAKKHHIFEYFGSKTAKFVIVIMGSAFDTVKNYVKIADKNYGVIKINLYRPFASDLFLKVLPKTVEKIAVLDRTKEQGSIGEPIYLDVSATILENKKNINVFGGRYGLGGKEFSPQMVKAVFQNLEQKNTKNHFTIGINDDLTHTSLKYNKKFFINDETKDILFYGLGSDGTVSSAKNITKILGDKKFVNSYFMYDSKKSGGLTRSFISYSTREFNKPYLSNSNNIVVCNNASFLTKYNVAKVIKPNGILLINSNYKNFEDIEKYCSDSIKKELATKNIKLYSIDANKIARENNLIGKISTIMQTAFFYISKCVNIDYANKKTIELIKATFSKKGEKVIEDNINAISNIFNKITKIEVKKSWKTLKNSILTANNEDFIEKYVKPILDLNGDELPVSQVNLYGENQVGTTQYEKRNYGTLLPKWNAEKCIQCGKCSFVCPHAVIRAKLLDEEQIKNSPKTLSLKQSLIQKDKKFTLEISPKDCLSCGLCESVCPVKAISHVSKEEIFDDENNNYQFTKDKNTFVPMVPLSPLKTQFLKPYFEFSGACAGCGETPYIKLLSQLVGNHLIIANATGCSSIYGGSAPTCPYTKDKNGNGTAWANSLFEDNAEFGLGIEKSQKLKRANFKNFVENNIEKLNENYKNLLEIWLKNYENYEKTNEIYQKLQIEKYSNNNEVEKYIFENLDLIVPKSVWLIGGDGWAYDIDFGGLDHILSTGENVKVLVLDTEVYSNTGGQMSKSTPRNAIAKFASSGKNTAKKNLALSLIQYQNVYVAEVCLGADMNQCVKAFDEAENFDGPSVIIAYCPCINHGIDMSKNILTEIDAVKCGYWHLFRFNPSLKDKNQNMMQIDSQKPTTSFEEHLLKERRFANFYEKNKDANDDFKNTEDDRKNFYETLLELQKRFEK